MNYLCHDCALRKGLIYNNSSTNLTGSRYQLEKYIKHTSPTRNYDINSIFVINKYDKYREYIVNAEHSGSVEIDDQNRVNIIWVAGEKTGAVYKNGNHEFDHNSIKVVLNSFPGKIHALTTGSNGFCSENCIECGRIIIR